MILSRAAKIVFSPTVALVSVFPYPFSWLSFAPFSSCQILPAFYSVFSLPAPKLSTILPVYPLSIPPHACPFVCSHAAPASSCVTQRVREPGCRGVHQLRARRRVFLCRLISAICGACDPSPITNHRR